MLEYKHVSWTVCRKKCKKITEIYVLLIIVKQKLYEKKKYTSGQWNEMSWVSYI